MFSGALGPQIVWVAIGGWFHQSGSVSLRGKTPTSKTFPCFSPSHECHPWPMGSASFFQGRYDPDPHGYSTWVALAVLGAYGGLGYVRALTQTDPAGRV